MSEPTTCAACGNPADPALTVLVWDDAWGTDDDAEVVAYCSSACEEQDMDSEWAPTPCDRCGREIRRAVSWMDLRDPRAYNFVADASGNPVCIRCAGIARHALTWHTPPLT